MAHGYQYNLVRSPNTIDLKIVGKNIFIRLVTESGIHRLTRISPYDERGRRHTSFATVLVSLAPENFIDCDKKQIRSYVFHPYKLVRDFRTKTETINLSQILNGEIDIFLNENCDENEQAFKEKLRRITKQKKKEPAN